MAILNYGVRRQTDTRSGGAAAEAVEQIRRRGYAIVHSGFSAEEIGRQREVFQRAFEGQEQLFGKPYLEKINEQHMVRAPMKYDQQAFLALAMNEEVLNVVNQLIGGQFVLNQQNGVINPGQSSYSQGRWHRDLPYQHFTSSDPLAVNALYCVDDFTSENGATLVIPGSHLFADFPSDKYADQNFTQLSAPAGSFLVLDCMLYHSGGSNMTESSRRGVNHVYGVPLLSPQIAIGEDIDQSRLTDIERNFLGLDYQPPRSVSTWFENRTQA